MIAIDFSQSIGPILLLLVGISMLFGLLLAGVLMVITKG